MIEETYLFGLSRDASIGLLLGFGISTFAYLGIFWVDAAAKNLKDRWEGKRWRAKK